ncbi:MAG: RagB/SusD family nutrient uptake outer membrane protein [Paludibacter sp.]|nr:RagB/SusD family nutrient uptake outer membrane protein [Bacteroidales bacterium]MCM1069787.1 RagB/SusD family nutrient uptake outer membrane protein [Prevotella sp.]MCM1354509.1 RagB/SusD family nutrient uptake outer membrane protein [Bacteroides sp.]MCM1443312.1 RagB/SusD family nutrient uptake outer membrane protein [Muribaculum sp.]MCM1482436.1 RagB/SusD family nutrient uptake outer membrane protein [Paludibacter sp.]
MKYRYILYAALVGLSMVSCSDNFLQREPAGNTMVASQFEKMSNTMEGSIRGIYSMLYTKISTDHAEFGKRGIDMYCDILSGDMALTAQDYGWFAVDEFMQTATSRTSYLWTYYYSMLHNINAAVQILKVQSDVIDKVAEYGFPGESDYNYSEAQKAAAYYYAVALTMRGYVFSNLANSYSPIQSILEQGGYTFENYKVAPVYTEINMDSPSPLSTIAEVYNRAELDLTTAIDYFEAFADGGTRTSKLEVDINVARGLLAYTMLNKASYETSSDEKRATLTKAQKYADDVITSADYDVIANKDLLTTGFNSVSSSSWIWGQEVTTETATGLASFFGQVDIHSYSYAWAGDTKVIDAELKSAIPAWDGRALWFNDGKASSKFADCPDGKFFSASNPTSVDRDDLDRRWLSDNVYMRLEMMYLIVAEAAYNLGDYTTAADYLTAITDQRLNLTSETAADEYATFKSSLAAAETLKDAIYYNWRVELWGEGYALQTFKRLGVTKKRGGNHLSGGGTEVNPGDGTFVFVVPSGETTYNPNL